MMFYRIASALLAYPDAELREALPEIATLIYAEPGMSADERAVLTRFVGWLSDSDSIAAEEDYVRTFDMVPEHSLHLTHHLIGEDKNRGPALIDLGEFYKSYGFGIAENELPDYLPLMLEFVSVLAADEGRIFLSRWNKVLRQLAANLAAAGSAYAPLLELLEARSRLVEASGGEVTAAVPRTDPCQDAGDFDPPVDWNAPPPLAPACAAPR